MLYKVVHTPVGQPVLRLAHASWLGGLFRRVGRLQGMVNLYYAAAVLWRAWSTGLVTALLIQLCKTSV